MGSMEEEMPIKFGTYNIRNGRNGGLEAALRGMAQANIDLGVFQDTKCTNGVYTRALARYHVVATDTLRRHCGGVALFYREEADFAVEEVRTYGPNVISFEVVTGQRRWYIIGCYIAPDDDWTIEWIVTALGDQPQGTALIVTGYFNKDLGEMASDRRGTEIAAAITEAGLEDMTAHFLPRKRRWGRELRTWSMVREGKAIQSRKDYILGTDCSLFRNVSVRDPRYNSDHYMVVGLLRGGTTRDHIRYIAGRRRMPLTTPKEPTREETLFKDLRRAVPKPHMQEQHRNAWISDLPSD